MFSVLNKGDHFQYPYFAIYFAKVIILTSRADKANDALGCGFTI